MAARRARSADTAVLPSTPQPPPPTRLPLRATATLLGDGGGGVDCTVLGACHGWLRGVCAAQCGELERSADSDRLSAGAASVERAARRLPSESEACAERSLIRARMASKAAERVAAEGGGCSAVGAAACSCGLQSRSMALTLLCGAGTPALPRRGGVAGWAREACAVCAARKSAVWWMAVEWLPY